MPFLDENVRKYFMDIETTYTNNEINSINGMDNIYDSKYEKIKKYSEFNFNDASNVLLYIVIKQLNNSLKCIKSENLSENIDSNKELNTEVIYDIDTINIKCKYICNFINLLFEDIECDNYLFIDCSDGTEKINNSFIHDKIEFKVKNYYKDESDDYMIRQIKMEKFVASADYLTEEIEIAEDEYIQTVSDQEKEYYIIEKGKKELFEKFGYEPNENELEEYKQNYLRNMAEEIDIMEDENEYSLNPKSDEVIDQGAEYGGLNEYDFETGDGFDYSDQQEYD